MKEVLEMIIEALQRLPTDQDREAALCTAQHDLRVSMRENNNDVFPPSVTLLAQTFPALKLAPILDPHHLWEWAQKRRGRPDVEHLATQYHAAVFILNVWSCATMVAWPPFEVFEAYAVWDDEHMDAFQAWAKDPWTPSITQKNPKDS